MIISNQTLKSINAENVSIPNDSLLQLPEKVLQFGTGVLLRGLPDYFIDKANKKNIFNGRVAVVKSTSKGDVKDFEDQNGLYTICVRGLENGQPVEENIISSAISRVLSADKDWSVILGIAKSSELQVIVSNTTEVGIQLVNESIAANPPLSFPAKVLAVLYARYKALGDSPASDIAVIATELIPENGKKLEGIVYQLAAFNHLEPEFSAWLNTHAFFCNSLVDRIVPGKPDDAALEKLEKQLGYKDSLLIMAEPYRLWAIEGNARVSELLNLESADHGVIVKPDIEIYRELKVRLLNGSHTLACGIAYLSGIDTVNTAMNDTALKDYISDVMQNEIVPAIPYKVEAAVASAFAGSVLDRFANPYIEHLWINITFQYVMKIKIRILPVLVQYYKIYNKVPQHIAFGFAAFLLFMRTNRKEGEKYFGDFKGREYPITDDQAAYFYEKSKLDTSVYVKSVLTDENLWGTDLSALTGFIETVEGNYNYISMNGVKQGLMQAN
ncbi:MAG TPA: tagaturonate reductase [Pedobacter sp.]|uniref:tagaturonate reductase n=1 Tax=Pedobacter sp. TaxID=1411316 RepID=UPI002C2E88D7|nr:tagaturonate reductase [Pedobacter sp.]HMI03102.1 tagaturonate reductase [Pedobacter sp.]